MLASVVKNPTMIMVTLLRGRVLSERNLWLLLNVRSRPGKPNQRKGQNEKFMNVAYFCEFWRFSLGKQARFTLNFCSGTTFTVVGRIKKVKSG